MITCIGASDSDIIKQASRNVAKESRKLKKEQEEKERELQERKRKMEELKKKSPEEILRKKLEVIEKQTQISKPTFVDIIGWDSIKRTVNMSLHQNKTLGGKLLFGPDGCGKTFISKAIANTAGLRYFNVSAEYLQSDHRMALDVLNQAIIYFHHHAPCLVVFEHFEEFFGGFEKDRRLMLGELNGLLDGMDTQSRTEGIVFVAVTSRPWDLAASTRSRFQSRIYFPPPSLEDRRLFVGRECISYAPISSNDLEYFAEKMDNYTFLELGDAVTKAGSDVSTMGVSWRAAIERALIRVQAKNRPSMLRCYEQFAETYDSADLDPMCWRL